MITARKDKEGTREDSNNKLVLYLESYSQHILKSYYVLVNVSLAGLLIFSRSCSYCSVYQFQYDVRLVHVSRELQLRLMGMSLFLSYLGLNHRAGLVEMLS